MRPLRFLVVEDDALLRGMLSSTFRRWGVACHAAASGKDAIIHCAEWKYHLVLTDLCLPDGGGDGLCTYLTMLPDRPRIVVMTGWPDRPREDEAFGRAADAFLRKPFRLADVRQAVATALAGYTDWVDSCCLQSA